MATEKYRRLKAYMVLIGANQGSIADEIGITRASLNSKLLGKTPFSQNEIEAITSIIKKKIPQVSEKELFFNQKINKTLN